MPEGPKLAQCVSCMTAPVRLGVTSRANSALAEMPLLPAKVTGSGEELCSCADGGFGSGVMLDIVLGKCCSAPASMAAVLPLGIPRHRMHCGDVGEI